MTIQDLQDGQTVTLRLGRAGRHQVDWEDWEDVKIRVGRSKNGQVIGVRPTNDSFWAEYDPRHDYHDGCFLAEDYYMEIQGLL